MADHSDHVIRVLKRNLRIANKTMGKQGETIHSLRADLAEVRELHSKIERGELRRLERVEPELRKLIGELAKDREALRDRIKELENPNDGVVAEVVPLDAEPTSEYVDQ
jgi:hypothetical protein